MFWAFCLSNFSTVLNVETYILYDFENVVRNPGYRLTHVGGFGCGVSYIGMKSQMYRDSP